MSTRKKNFDIAIIALLSAMTIVLQVVGALLSAALPFTVSLCLIPIVVAAVFYKLRGGLIVGTVFGLVVFFTCVTGIDAGGLMFFQLSWYGTAVLSIGRCALTGLCAFLLHKIFKKLIKNNYLAVSLTSFFTPICNTAFFVLFYFLFFHDVFLSELAKAGGFLALLAASVLMNMIFEIIYTAILTPPVVIALRKAMTKFEFN